MKLNHDLNAADMRVAANNNALELIDGPKTSTRQSVDGVNRSDDQKTRNVNPPVFHTFLSMLMVGVDVIDGPRRPL